MNGRRPALIIARSTQFRESLQILMQASPKVGSIYVAENGPSAQGSVGKLQPALVLLDTDMANSEIRTMLDRFKVQWAQARYLVFVDEDSKRRHANEAGADVVLVKGVRATTILETIDVLLSENYSSLKTFGGE